jgi:hypothetical protein
MQLHRLLELAHRYSANYIDTVDYRPVFPDENDLNALAVFEGLCCVNFLPAQHGHPVQVFRKPMHRTVLQRTDFARQQKPSAPS